MQIKALFLILLICVNLICYADSDFQGSIKPIPEELQKMMIGKTWHTGCPVALKDLSYLQVSYWGFDKHAHTGEIIIHQRLALEGLWQMTKGYALLFIVL